MRISPRKGFTFHNKRGSGYLLEITNEELFKDFMESLNEGIYFQVKERPAQILAYLAIQTDIFQWITLLILFKYLRQL